MGQHWSSCVRPTLDQLKEQPSHPTSSKTLSGRRDDQGSAGIKSAFVIAKPSSTSLKAAGGKAKPPEQEGPVAAVEAEAKIPGRNIELRQEIEPASPLGRLGYGLTLYEEVDSDPTSNQGVVTPWAAADSSSEIRTPEKPTEAGLSDESIVQLEPVDHGLSFSVAPKAKPGAMGDEKGKLGPSPDYASHWYWLTTVQGIPPAVARAIASQKDSETIGNMEVRVMASAPGSYDLELLKAPNGSRLLKNPAKLDEEEGGRTLIVASVAVPHLELLKKRGFEELTFPESLYEAMPLSDSPPSPKPETGPSPNSVLLKHPGGFEERAETSETNSREAGEGSGSSSGADLRKSPPFGSAPLQSDSQLSLEAAIQPSTPPPSDPPRANEQRTTSAPSAERGTPSVDEPLWGPFFPATSNEPVAVGVVDRGWCPCILRRVGNLDRVVFYGKRPLGSKHPNHGWAYVPDLPPWVEYTQLALVEMEGSAPCVGGWHCAGLHGLQMLRIVAANAPKEAKIFYWNYEGAGTGDPQAATDVDTIYAAAKRIADYGRENDFSCVVSCSLECSLGSHDQWERLQARLDALAGDEGKFPRGITFVVAAGNLRRDGYHARFVIGEPLNYESQAAHTRRIDFMIVTGEGSDRNDDLDQLEVEFWFDRPHQRYVPELVLKESGPDDHEFRSIDDRLSVLRRKGSNEVVAYIKDVSGPKGGSAFKERCGVRVSLPGPSPAGSTRFFKLSVVNLPPGAFPTIVDAWADRRCSIHPASFVEVPEEEQIPLVGEGWTLSGLTGSLHTVVVAAALSLDVADGAEAKTLDTSGFGPTRTENEQPCVLACGAFIVEYGNEGSDGVRVILGRRDFSGTSHATAAVAGLVAQRLGRGVNGSIREGFKEAFRLVRGMQDSKHHHGRGFGFVDQKVAKFFVGDRGTQVV